MGSMEIIASEVQKDSDELTLQFMSPKFENALFVFKSKYLGSRGGTDFIDWKFRQGPVDCRDCIILAIDSDETIVGHLAAVVFPAVPGCRFPFIALGTEAIVSEKYRGGKYNIFRKMDALLGERLAEKGVKLWFGTPIKQGYLVAKRLYQRADGPKSIFQSKIFTPALWLPQGLLRKAAHRLFVFGRFRLPRLPVGWSFTLIDNFVALDIDAFCGEFMRNIEFGTCRNAEFLNWRYGGGDGYTYERIRLAQGDQLIGLAVVRIHPKRCEAAALMEVMALDSRGYDILINVCMQVASRNAPILTVMGIVDTLAYEAYLRYGFRSHSEILKGIGQALRRIPSKVRKWLMAKAENHFHLDDYLTVYYYPEPGKSKEYAKGRWYYTLGEKFGF